MPMEVWELVVRESVRDTLAAYHAAGDRGRLDELSDCFHPDGVLEIAGQEPWRGRSAIRDGLSSRLAANAQASDRVAAPLTHVRHHLATTHFQVVTATEVRASSYFAVMTDVGLDHWGRYADVLSPVLAPGGDRWLFNLRSVHMDGYAPGSRFAGAP
jgi:hypothetical protein